MILRKTSEVRKDLCRCFLSSGFAYTESLNFAVIYLLHGEVYVVRRCFVCFGCFQCSPFHHIGFILSHVLVTIDGVWSGNWIY
jgi:hypothetical protein